MTSTDIENERAFFDRLARLDSYCENTESDFAEICHRLLDSYGQLRILDVGCGLGTNSLRLARMGHTVIGIDISWEAVKTAVRRALLQGLDAKFLVQDARYLSFPPDSFDLCFCGGLLHHLPDLQPVARELFCVLKDGGMVCSYDPNALHPYVRLVQKLRAWGLGRKRHTKEERALTPAEIQAGFAAAGFKDFQFQTMIFLSQKKNVVYREILLLLLRIYYRFGNGLGKGNALLMSCIKRGNHRSR
ncbi:MAG: class I SAM-dependent methyltransferase [Chloroflexi bacterium]|nr:class I SAM-dependent methyltransferase [Chloroflexota bacterium]MCL5075285.1 class I SAM-dependent methyltransferase [Chloroflexota bacterium]